jgi:hypothetical protein
MLCYKGGSLQADNFQFGVGDEALVKIIWNLFTNFFYSKRQRKV